MMSAVARAEKRLGIKVSENLLREAEELTNQKMKAKGLPEDYEDLLLEDEIVDACIRAAINGRCA